MEETNQGRVACDQLEIIAFLHVLTLQKLFEKDLRLNYVKDLNPIKFFYYNLPL